MLLSDNRNIVIIGFSMQGTVLNMFPCVLMWLDIILMVYCNIICTGLPLRLFSTLVFF